MKRIVRLRLAVSHSARLSNDSTELVVFSGKFSYKDNYEQFITPSIRFNVFEIAVSETAQKLKCPGLEAV
jgi:hypothetical protein